MKIYNLMVFAVMVVAISRAEAVTIKYSCTSSDLNYRSLTLNLEHGDSPAAQVEDLTVLNRTHSGLKQTKISPKDSVALQKTIQGYVATFNVPPYSIFSMTLSPMVGKTLNNREPRSWLESFQMALFHQVKESFSIAVFHCVLEK